MDKWPDGHHQYIKQSLQHSEKQQTFSHETAEHNQYLSVLNIPITIHYKSVTKWTNLELSLKTILHNYREASFSKFRIAMKELLLSGNSGFSTSSFQTELCNLVSSLNFNIIITGFQWFLLYQFHWRGLLTFGGWNTARNLHTFQNLMVTTDIGKTCLCSSTLQHMQDQESKW